MAGLMTGDPSTHHEAYEGGSFRASQERPDENGGDWYLSRKEIRELPIATKWYRFEGKRTYLCISHVVYLPTRSGHAAKSIFNLWIVAIFWIKLAKMKKEVSYWELLGYLLPFAYCFLSSPLCLAT
ncbi:hypothetical protein HAX54_009484 [Datura stramonium]|uniref:Uncharacterized protein n=1 Tax=Datura stramonium TaxID=4076 RepID=A0ABS8WVF2_DATST|nr:hypothetical protein [Datura stramonium]